MKINKIYKVNVMDNNHNGMGIAKIDNMPIFINNALKGDIINIKIIKINRKYAIGTIESFITKVKREKIDCPYYESCGGCNLLHVPYEKENQLKKEYIKKLFPNYNINIISNKRLNYRNKITLHVNNNELGLYEDNSNTIIPINKCLLVRENINDLITKLNNFDLTNISEIVIKEGINGLLISIKGKFKETDLKELINDDKVISVYENDKLIFGEKGIIKTIGDINYIVNNKSFFQVNNECTKAIYDKLKENIEKDSSLLDLYCGSGTIGIYCSSLCENITGVEINKDSVECCRKNLDINRINNYKIIEGNASIIKENFDIVIVDPPRKGLSREVIDNLNNQKTKKIIYISCNPSTLKRDIQLLTNYELQEINAYNMFPATKHVECVCVLNRR